MGRVIKWTLDAPVKCQQVSLLVPGSPLIEMGLLSLLRHLESLDTCCKMGVPEFCWLVSSWSRSMEEYFSF